MVVSQEPFDTGDLGVVQLGASDVEATEDRREAGGQIRVLDPEHGVHDDECMDEITGVVPGCDLRIVFHDGKTERDESKQRDLLEEKECEVTRRELAERCAIQTTHRSSQAGLAIVRVAKVDAGELRQR